LHYKEFFARPSPSSIKKYSRQGNISINTKLLRFLIPLNNKRKYILKINGGLKLRKKREKKKEDIKKEVEEKEG
jgi:hypothetical protein